MDLGATNRWEPVAKNFRREFRVILFDYVGHGGSDPSAYSAERYVSLDGFADDVSRSVAPSNFAMQYSSGTP